MTPEQKKLWLCYHARAMQAILEACTHAQIHNSAQVPDEETIAGWATHQADAMLEAAIKRGAL